MDTDSIMIFDNKELLITLGIIKISWLKKKKRERNGMNALHTITLLENIVIRVFFLFPKPLILKFAKHKCNRILNLLVEVVAEAGGEWAKRHFSISSIGTGTAN